MRSYSFKIQMGPIFGHQVRSSDSDDLSEWSWQFNLKVFESFEFPMETSNGLSDYVRQLRGLFGFEISNIENFFWIKKVRKRIFFEIIFLRSIEETYWKFISRSIEMHWNRAKFRAKFIGILGENQMGSMNGILWSSARQMSTESSGQPRKFGKRSFCSTWKDSKASRNQRNSPITRWKWCTLLHSERLSPHTQPHSTKALLFACRIRS